MIETTQGTLTIIDVNTTAPKYFWKGELLSHVKSVMAINASGGEVRVNMRVTDPAKVVPALTTTEIERLNFLYNEMSMSPNIKVIKT